MNTGDVLKLSYTASNGILATDEFLCDADGVAATRGVIRLEDGGQFRAEAGGQDWASQILLDGLSVAVTGFNYPTDGKIHLIEVTVGFDDIRIGYICARRDGSFNCTSVLSDVEIVKSGSPARSYAIDDNRDTIKDSVGGFDGTVINGNNDDWGKFFRNDTGWIGFNLAAPPWDSTTQELVIA